MTEILLGLLVFLSTACVDYCHARYVQALTARRRWQASRWSVSQWGAATVGFAVVIKVSFWYLPAEALGLALGTFLAVGPPE